MTVLAPPGSTFEATLIGAPTDLTGTLGFQVVDTENLDIVIPRRTDNIVEIAPGVYSTTDTAPANEGGYLIVWDYASISTTEDLVVAATTPSILLPPDGYATVAGVRVYAPELATYSDDEIHAEIRKAERDIDWYAGYSGVPDEATGLRFVPLTGIESRNAIAIHRATCAQVEYRFYMGKAFTVDELQYEEVQGRDQTVKKPQRVGPAARSEFPQGLRKLTGRFA